MKSPPASSLNALRTMRATRSVSRRELEFRRLVWSLGVRGYRVGAKLPGKPDMYFPGVRLAVFIHGCYWHRCPKCELQLPKANDEFWREKFARNVERDSWAASQLRQAGIRVETIWEHELMSDSHGRASELVALLHELGTAHRSRTARVGV
jgi:DNA mismatch endonuclease, patch repair protein